ncbi:MAG: hypothetical protein J6R79_01695 [Bacteroidaceae bacterium]|nr:hypothetical protein [Bacteroidaceae bacterium]
MDYYYGFYELGYIEYYWYLLYSLYYEFLEYPPMVRICSLVLTGLFLIIPISCLTLIVRNYLIKRRQNKLDNARKIYLETFRKILTDPEDLMPERVREMIAEKRKKSVDAKFTNEELNLFAQILKEKVQDYNRKNINRNNYQQILYVLNMSAWLEDIIEKKGVKRSIEAFNLAQVLDCPLRGSVSARFAYHKDPYLRKVARITYMLTNKEEPFRYIEGEHNYTYVESDGPILHDILAYRFDNGLMMPNFIEWIKLDQPTNKFRLFCMTEILFFKREEEYDDLYEYMLKSNDSQVKGYAIRVLGKVGYKKVEQDLYDMLHSAQGILKISIIACLNDLAVRGARVVELYKSIYAKSRRENEAMTTLNALYNCGAEGRAAFHELERIAPKNEQMRFAHIMNPITNDRAYER